jgi:hypothetical protein
MKNKVITLEDQLKSEGNSQDAEGCQRRGAGEEVEASEGKMYIERCNNAVYY